jgi:hypothetical protein
MGRFGPFGMGMGMNPLAALVGGLFGLFWLSINYFS